MKKSSMAPVNIKLMRAKNLLNNLSQELKEFIESHPYETYLNKNKITDYWEIKIRIKKEPPEEWSAQVGDIIHNLRSALDLLVFQLFLANKITPNENSRYPIYSLKKDFLRDGVRGLKGIDPKAIRIIKKTKPYRRGNKKLFQLHKLDIIDKHRIIIGVGGSHESLVIDFSKMLNDIGGFSEQFPPMPIGLRPADKQFPLKDGSTLFSFKDDPKKYSNTKNILEISIGDGNILKSEPLVKTMASFLNEVEKIIEDLAHFV